METRPVPPRHYQDVHVRLRDHIARRAFLQGLLASTAMPMMRSISIEILPPRPEDGPLIGCIDGVPIYADPQQP